MPDDLPVLWERWAPLSTEEAPALLDWVRAEGLDPEVLVGVEVVVLDAPCLRLHAIAFDESGLPILTPNGEEVAIAPVLRPFRSWPPGAN